MGFSERTQRTLFGSLVFVRLKKEEEHYERADHTAVTSNITHAKITYSTQVVLRRIR